MRILLVGCSMSGKLIDKKQLPTHQEFSAICLKNPKSGVPIFFIMVGHSFGLVSAVYNYNRRSGAMNEFFVSLFGLFAFSFYTYGFEPKSTAES